MILFVTSVSDTCFVIVLSSDMHALLLRGKSIQDQGQGLGPDRVLDHGQDQGQDQDLGQGVVVLQG